MGNMHKEPLEDYGPLAPLLGEWRGNKGLDIAPDPDGKEENHYHESLVFEGIGEVTNAESQNLMAVCYQQKVWRNNDDKSIHHQLGYWLWDRQTDEVMHSFTIPRGVTVLAGGSPQFNPSLQKLVLHVHAKVGVAQWGILQSPFMLKNAQTLEFKQSLSLEGDQLSYQQTSMVDIYGNVFEHTDQSTLMRLRNEPSPA